VPLNSSQIVVRGDPRADLVGLTFDAGGKVGGKTASVLDTLREFGYQATFFLTGEWAEANPALVRRMVAEGHELANHTYDHPYLTRVSDDEIVSQLSRTEQVVQRVAGVSLTRYVRPPYGDYNQRVLGVLVKHSYIGVLWTLDSTDWRNETTAHDVAQRVATKANAGDIVVFHCYPAKTAEALPVALDGLKARHLRGGSLSQVLGR
jgi:peptidoglycan/xylan/chitin deacetylase (PgdA/CDA1 family)